MDSLFDVFDEQPKAGDGGPLDRPKPSKKRSANGEVKHKKERMESQLTGSSKSTMVGSRKLHVGNLPYEATAEDVRMLFADFSV